MKVTSMCKKQPEASAFLSSEASSVTGLQGNFTKETFSIATDILSSISTKKRCYSISETESKCDLQLKHKHLKLKTDLIISRIYFIHLWIAGSKEKTAGRGPCAWLGRHKELSSRAWGTAELNILWPGQEGKHSYATITNSKAR